MHSDLPTLYSSPACRLRADLSNSIQGQLMNRPAPRSIIASIALIIPLLLFANGCAAPARFKAPKWQWAISAGSRDLVTGHALTIADDGDLYMAGTTTDTVVFGDRAVRSYAHFTGFVVRYAKASPDDPMLLATFGALPGVKGHASVFAIDVDRDENIYVTGEFGGTAAFGEAKDSILFSAEMHPKTGRRPGFVAKFDSSGRIAWALPIIAPDGENVRTVSVSDNGDCYFGFHVNGIVKIGDTTLHFTERRALVVSLRGDGTRRWIKVLGGEKSSYYLDTEIDPAGNLAVWWGRELRPEIRRPNGSGVGASYTHLLESYTPEGERRWTSPVGWGSDITTGRIYFDRDAILLQGPYVPDTTSGITWLTPRSYNLVSRFDMRGRPEGCFAVGMPGEYFRGGGVDADGNYYYVSSYEDHLRLDKSIPDSISASLFPKTVGGRDVMVICRDARSGVFRWIWTTGGHGSESILDAVVDPAGNIYITGWFSDQARFGSFELEARVRSDYFLAKLGREE